MNAPENKPAFLPFALPEIGEEEIAEVIDTLKSGWITTGPKAKRFEADFAKFLGGGGEGVGGGDDLVAGADADGLQRQVQAGGGRVDGDAMQALDVIAGITQPGLEVGLEALGLGAGGDPA